MADLATVCLNRIKPTYASLHQDHPALPPSNGGPSNCSKSAPNWAPRKQNPQPPTTITPGQGPSGALSGGKFG